jgi:hypothetical protein
MKRHISYPKIGQFRNIITNINRESTYVCLDDTGTAVFDPSKKKPILEFTGTVKLHGTNAAVCYNNDDGFWIQSRKNIITVERDNAGFAFFATSKEEQLQSLIFHIAGKYDIDTTIYTISIYGEWAGKGIQKTVGISQLEKGFYIFGVKISNLNDDEFNSYWLPSSELSSIENNIFNVEDYKTYKLKVDFNYPELIQNQLQEITEQVEKECPISKALGILGMGEGVVWSTIFNGTVHRFKVKGEKHSISKVKTLAPVDVEKVNSTREFVEYAVTDNRLSQGFLEVFGATNYPDIKKLGDYIRWVIKDIMEEEIDTMTKNNLEPKDVNKYISVKVREEFFKLN